MNGLPPVATTDACVEPCSALLSAEQLNKSCFCVAVDPLVLRGQLERLLAAQSVPGTLAASHAHLFSALPVYVSRQHIAQVTAVVGAIEEVTGLDAYATAVMAWAPGIARFDPGSPGGLLGLDFHLGPEGPRLIEINTNPGGALLNGLLGEAQQACIAGLAAPPTGTGRMDEAVMHSLLAEWRLQRGDASPGLIAIVDEAPEQQYLYPEFLLYQQLLRARGYRAEICAPRALARKQGKLWLGDASVDFVYNRLTDFALNEPAHEDLRAAYLANEVALSPHPRSHALFADKRNLSVLGSREFLMHSGASAASAAILVAAIPLTQLLTPENRDEMWAARRHLFFKPAAGFGSKASYRGDKLTRRAWDEIAAGTYVAQEIVPPSERQIGPGAPALKVDIRCYAYRGKVLMFAARMYQGQTTNFRTHGGGFAPVLSRL
ncbi:MAG: hypothetical protein H7147_02390 [Frankiaceae bacterium]|nr:hypothetical protein [Arenimonas sp.]